jgi:hypothetical protein
MQDTGAKAGHLRVVRHTADRTGRLCSIQASPHAFPEISYCTLVWRELAICQGIVKFLSLLDDGHWARDRLTERGKTDRKFCTSLTNPRQIRHTCLVP